MDSDLLPRTVFALSLFLSTSSLNYGGQGRSYILIQEDEKEKDTVIPGIEGLFRTSSQGSSDLVGTRKEFCFF